MYKSVHRHSIVAYLFFQPCRIDHLLGRNLFENLTVLRFSNLIFEPLWSRTYIRSVQVNSFLLLNTKTSTFGFHYMLHITACFNDYAGHFVRRNGCAVGEVHDIYFFCSFSNIALYDITLLAFLLLYAGILMVMVSFET